jgi:hypothetical protein
MSTAAKSPTIDANTIEREIVERLRTAKLRPRFDKVALRLVSELKAALASVVPEGRSVVFTISAPIRLPAKPTSGAGKHGALQPPRRRAPCDRARRRGSNPPAGRRPQAHAQGAGFFMHSLESDASAILAVAEARLIEPNGDKQRRTSRTTLEEGVSRGPRRTLSSSRRSRSFRDESCSTIRRRTPSEARAGAA